MKIIRFLVKERKEIKMKFAYEKGKSSLLKIDLKKNNIQNLEFSIKL
jgi:hypothetical protein